MPEMCLGLGMPSRRTEGLVSDPDGLPAGAIAFANIREGTYFYGGNMLSDIFTENTDFATFSEDCIISGIGLTQWGGPNDPVLGPALTADMLADGFTMICTIYTNATYTIEVANVPAFDDDVTFAIAPTQNSTSVTPNFDSEAAATYDVAPGVGMHKVAVTYDGGVSKMCIDGGTVISLDAGAQTLNTIGFLSADTLSELVVYPVKSNAEMQSLCSLNRAALPEYTVNPAISGTAQVGQTLSVSDGTLSNGGAVYLKQWLDSTLTPVAGTTYEVQPTDEGGNVYCAVFAENATGYVYYLAISDTIAPA